MNLGKAIRSCRKSKSLTLAQLARKARVTPSYLSKIERGNSAKVPVATVERIRRALGVTAPLFAFMAAERRDLRGLDPALKRRLRAAIVYLMKAMR
jgi:transcriptional regulator with XRE-family HTH domain